MPISFAVAFARFAHVKTSAACLTLAVLALAGVPLIAAVASSSPTPPTQLIYSTQWNQDEATPEFRNFSEWTNAYLVATDTATKTRLLAEGLALAHVRHAALAELIRTNPASAIANAVPAAIRRQLPAEILAELETRVSGTGDLTVRIREDARGQRDQWERIVTLNGEYFPAYVYGRRAEEMTKTQIPLHGIALDGVLALHESPVRLIETDEMTSPGGAVAEIAGTIRRFASNESLRIAVGRLESVEAGINPRPSAVSFLENAGGTVDTAPATAADTAANHTIGAKNVLLMRVDFTDLTGDPKNGQDGTVYTAAAAQTFADTMLAPLYAKSSYGTTTLTTTVTSLIRLPQTAQYYATAQNASGAFIGDVQLKADAQTAAAAAGYVAGNFDRVIVLHSNFSNLPGTHTAYGGVGDLGGTYVLINSYLDLRVTSHEFGHTFGLLHANLWQTSDGNPISATGSSIEYADNYDIVGGGGPGGSADQRIDFNPWYKSLLGWLNSTQVNTVTTSGTYRVYAFDETNATAAAGELIALKVHKDAGTDYWIGLRRNFTDNAAAFHGAYIIWGYPSFVHSNLLNFTTPGGDYRDAPLGVGKGFTDPGANVTIRVAAEGGTAPNYYLDIEVTIGAAPPAIVTNPSASVAVLAGQAATFTAAAIGNPAPAFQWQRLAAGSATWSDLSDAGFYSGTHSATLTVRGTTPDMQGDQFRCAASNSAGAATSAASSLTVTSAIWQTYAGSAGLRFGTDGALSVARFAETNFITRDAAGNLFLSAAGNRTIRKISSLGIVSTIAGTEGVSGSLDGTGTAAQFFSPGGIAVDSAGTLFVADTGSHSIRRISPTGVVTTIAGSSGNAGAVDGTGTAARFNVPVGLVVDSAGNLFVADRNNQAIRKITPAGVVTTFAGQLGAGGSANGVGTAARFSSPEGLAIDGSGTLYVGDAGNRVIRKIAPDGTVTTFAGQIGSSGSTDGTTGTARFGTNLYGVAVDPDGTVYVGDTDNATIRKITPAGVVSTIGGLAGTIGSTDGLPANARFSQPRGVVGDGTGALYVADYGNSTVRKLLVPPTAPTAPTVAALKRSRYNFVGDQVVIEVTVTGYPAPLCQWQRSIDAGVTWQDLANDATYSGTTSARLTIASVTAAMNGYQFRCAAANASGAAVLQPTLLLVYSVTTFAGSPGTPGATDGPGTTARFRDPRGLALDAAGNLYVADRGNHTIRKITPAGQVSTVAGLAGTSGTASGSAAVARFNLPNSVAVARDGTLYVSDNTQTVRSVASDGTVTLLAGAVNTAAFADGTGGAARFNSPAGIALDANGNLLLADSANQIIRIITPTGSVSTLAGSPGISGYVTIDGTGSAARFNSPVGVALAPNGNLYVADTSNFRIRSVTPAGVVTTLAGTNNWGSTDGVGANGWFDGPTAVALDPLGNAYVADTNNNLLRLLTPDNEVITIAGADVDGASTDGAARAARFNAPRGIAVDSAGVIYIADSANNTIRRFGPAGGVAFNIKPPSIAVAPNSPVAPLGGQATFSVVVDSVATPTYQWFKNGTPIAGATGASFKISSVAAGDTGSYTVSATTAFGTVTSSAGSLTIGTVSNPGRLINLSILTSIDAPGSSFTMGVVTGGSGTSGTKSLLVRAAGPSLGALGVGGALSDPNMEFFAGSTKIGENDNWGGGATLSAAFAAVGAFPYASADSKDSAIYNTAVVPGGNSVKVTGVGGSTGTVIAEIYDSTPSSSFATTTPRLINVSVLKDLGTGFTLGFVVGGSTPCKVLVRAVGPGLTQLGVGGALTDPKVTLFAGSTKVDENDDWGGSAALTAAMSQVGAFALTASSKDAALLATLQPGSYSVQVSGAAGTTGLVIAEVYEVP